MSYSVDHNLHRILKTVRRIDGVKAVVDGRQCTLFCTNDYLGLSKHPDVTAAAKAAVDEAGFGAGSAPLIAGHSVYHAVLQSELASFKGTGAALIFGSGYLANSGIAPALAAEGDIILSDSLNHASIIDGCRLSRAGVTIYEHCDLDSLEQNLKRCGGHGRRIIITEGVFSMDGDIAPLPGINELAKKYDAAIILDEAHSTGVLGKGGRGTTEHFGLNADGFIQMGTLGKALGSYGAFVAADSGSVDHFLNSARSFIFSTAIPAAACAAACASLKLIVKEPGLRVRLKENAAHLRAGLKSLGYEVAGDDTPIIPAITGGADDAVSLASMLLDRGFYAPAIRPPTVPDNKCRIRFTVSSLHTEEDIERLLDIMGKA